MRSAERCFPRWNACHASHRSVTLHDMVSTDTLPIIQRTYDVYKAVIQLTGQMDKRWRYTLGARIETSLLDLLRELLMAKHAPKSLKSGYLIRASSHHELTVLTLRLALELKLANPTKLLQIQSTLAEVGRMLGGWLRSLAP